MTNTVKKIFKPFKRVL